MIAQERQHEYNEYNDNIKYERELSKRHEHWHGYINNFNKYKT